MNPRIPTIGTMLSGLLIFTLIVLGIGILRGESSVENYLKLKKTQKILDETVSNLEEQNELLKKEVVKLKKSKSYAKKVLRDKYHLTDADESIIFFAE